MDKIELLKQRWKVIADYPNNPYKVGHIIQPEFGWIKDYIKPYPHLFRELHWSEDREILDMPEYVKRGSSGTNVSKVIKCDFDENEITVDEGYRYTLTSYLSYRLPATESEYNDYINSKIK